VGGRRRTSLNDPERMTANRSFNRSLGLERTRSTMLWKRDPGVSPQRSSEDSREEARLGGPETQPPASMLASKSQLSCFLRKSGEESGEGVSGESAIVLPRRKRPLPRLLVVGEAGGVAAADAPAWKPARRSSKR